MSQWCHMLVVKLLGFSLSSLFALPSLAMQVTPDSFEHAGQRLSGFLISAREQEVVQRVAIMVHGDGAMPYDAHGYYRPIWNRLIKAGYTVFSWDKPGVGQSEGQWLHQSMRDRQGEVESAMTHIKMRFSLDDHHLGLVGFSQAGWVVPFLAQQHQELCFAMGAGFALNWMQQSWYLTEQRMQLQGANQFELAEAYERHVAEQAFLNRQPDYTEYLARQDEASGVMSPERFQFVLLNYQADATEDYLGIATPFLLLLGDHDLNVDVRHTYRTLSPFVEYSPNFQIQMVENATHSLLRHPRFSTQDPGIWFWLRFSLNKERAFAVGVLDYIEQWVRDTSEHC